MWRRRELNSRLQRWPVQISEQEIIGKNRNVTKLYDFSTFFFLKAFNPSSESKSAKKENFDKKEPKKYEIAQKKKNIPLEVDWKITLFARSSPSAGFSKYSAKKSDKEWQIF